MPPPLNFQKQAGNALFLILIAVALFAGLSYAVTRSGRSGNGGVSRETTTIAAARIISYLNMMRTTVLRLQLSSKCADDKISFYTGASGFYTDVTPGDTSCNIFTPGAGGMPFENIPLEFMPAGTSASWATSWMTQDGAQAVNAGITGNPISPPVSALDLIIVMPVMTQALCDAINQQLTLPANISTAYFHGVYIQEADGNYVGFPDGTQYPSDATGFPAGATAACVAAVAGYWPTSTAPGAVGANWVFYYTLIER